MCGNGAGIGITLVTIAALQKIIPLVPPQARAACFGEAVGATTPRAAGLAVAAAAPLPAGATA